MRSAENESSFQSASFSSSQGAWISVSSRSKAERTVDGMGGACGMTAAGLGLSNLA
jgi:hypothetical protein